MRKSTIFTLFASLLFITLPIMLSAQRWAEMMQDGKANFYEIQATFETEFTGDPNERGSGYKPYKRWEFDTEERVYPSGEFPANYHVFKEYMAFMGRKGDRTSAASSRSLGNWESLGPYDWENINGWNPGNGRVNFITEEPGNPNTVYVGMPSGGLWRTEDGGETWTPLTDFLPSMGVSGIVIDPSNTDVIYIATGDRDANDYMGVGVLKSTDYGATWQTTGKTWELANGIKSNWLIMHPTDYETLYLGSNDGLFRSTDGAESWELILNGNVREVALHPTNPDIVYAVTNRFHRSENGGESFQMINEGLPPMSEVNRFSLAVSPALPNTVYVLAGDAQTSGFRGLFRSTDAGMTFSERADSPNILGYSSEGTSTGGQSWYDLALAADPNNGSRIITGGINVWRSISGGLNYNPISHWVYPASIGYTHADIHFLRYIDNRLYCGSDGGIFISYDHGNNWIDLTKGLNITQTYRFDFTEDEPYKILAGTQDNGTNFLMDDGIFYHIRGGDGNGAAINWENPDIIYTAYPYGNIQLSTDGGVEYVNLAGDIEENGLWVTPYLLDPNDPSILYAGFQSIWKHHPNDGWTNLGATSGTSFRALAVAPGSSDYIYAARGGVLVWSHDGGENWSITNQGLAGTNITDIAVNPTNPENVIVTCSGYQSGNKVYTSWDGGQTFENISFNLPNIPALSVVFEESETNGIYVGMDAGVYYTNDSLANWVDFMEGLPRTKARQMKIAHNIGKIRVSTYGRGFWESDLYSPLAEPPMASFEANTTVVCAGDSVVFTDLSYNAAPGWQWQFEGGAPAQSEERDPVVYFPNEGLFSVTLEVSNSFGTGQTTETQYILVLGDGEETPYTESFEDFESLFENQWVADNPNEDVTWELNTSVGFESNQSVWIDNLQNVNGRVDELNSPTIDLSNVAGATLSFKVAYAQRNAGDDDRLRVYISNDCGQSWNLRGQWRGMTNLPTAEATESPFVPQSADEWQEITITNIGQNYWGPGFMFMFRFTNNNGNNIYIDDINLTTTMVSVEELDKEPATVELYPNPAVGFTYLEFDLPNSARVSYRVMDATGRLLDEKQLGQLPAGDFRETIHTYSYRSGMYLVQLQINDQSVVRKLFVD